ncbi:MAG TPA: NAD(P)-binding protein [Acidimicrobiales bacterium]|nr:NAD(P)-binding protein [Acidimicrobiales bacterium]
MASIVVTGAGMAGLTTAMLLADDGHQVVVLERDPAVPPPPAEAWGTWKRRGVVQFRLAHILQPRFRKEAEMALPRVITALEAAGALRLNFVMDAPTELTGGTRPGDGDFEVVTARRPVVESVIAACADDTPGVTVRRGVAIAGVTTGSKARAGVPHVTGIRTEAGEEIGADLVVDAAGRRSPLPGWLEAAGGRRPDEELEDSGFIYYGRHFRSADGSLPPIMGPLLQNYGSISVLTLPADNGTWGIVMVGSAADSALRGLRDTDSWNAVVRSLPFAAHWLDGEPLEDGIQMMAKIEDRHRAFMIDGQPVATGVAAVADAWACTNPSLGRGISMGFLHSLALRDTLRQTPGDDPVALMGAWSDVTEETVEPWYRATVAFDRHRLAEIDAEIRGEPYRPGDPVWDIGQGLRFAAGQDPDCLRAFLSIVGVLESAEEAVARPGVLEKVVALGDGWRHAARFGPSRRELLAMVSP